MASGSDDKTIRIWKVATLECIATLESSSRVCALACLGGGRLASGSYKSIHLWDIAQRECVATLRGRGERSRS